MKKIHHLIAFLVLFSLTLNISGQGFQVKGRITEASTGEPMIGVSITIVGDIHGTVSGYDGNFALRSKLPPPFTLHFSFVSFEPQDATISDSTKFLNIKMNEQPYLGQEVVISASRMEESILRSPVSIEKLNLRDIQQLSTANFYEGLYQLKGVDMNVHGLTFRLPNARGFNDYTNYRMNQIIDGVENISPGLSFSAGNIFGLSQLDVESLEMVIGASSALYGPGGMNGTLVMTSKDPFQYQGLSISAQSGVMNIGSSVLSAPTPMIDMNLRYAKAFNDKLAFKIVGTYLSATDWQASDLRDRTNLDDPSLTRFTNPGYDGVNVYGDETLVSLNLKDVASQVINGIAASQGISQGTPEYNALYNKAIPFFPDQIVTRTGWLEKDIAGSKTENIRLAGAVHYLINDRLEAIAQTNFAMGTSVYTAQNRFSARDFNITYGKLELNDPDFYIRAWGVMESSGSSYDIGGAALLMNEEWKPSQQWFSDYLSAYTQTALLTGDMNNAHQFARLVSDNRDPRTGIVFDNSKPAFPISGTPEFSQILNKITSTPLPDGGAMVYDKSKMGQIEGMYNFTHLVKFIELQAGISERFYLINSNGTIFTDEPGHPIRINQFGTYVQVNKNFLDDHLRITGAFRYDKNQNFQAQYTPRFSLIYFIDNKKEHSIRGTFQTAYRFPSSSDQWVDINAGIFRTIGGMPQVQNKYGFNTIPLYPLSGRNPVTDKPVTENGPIVLPGLAPEKVTSAEIGYKGLILGKKLFLDTYAYINKYKGFEAVQLVAQLAKDTESGKDQYYQTYFSTNDPVTSFGWAIGLDYKLPDGILIRGNVAYDKLLEDILSPGVETRFNTPDYRANLSIGHQEIIRNLGFNLNVHWQNSFFWESGFGAGMIPATTTVDAHVSYKVSKIHMVFKLGGSNLLNSYYTSSFGSARIGGMYYISMTYDDIMGYAGRNKKQTP